MIHGVTGDECLEGTKQVPKKWKACCKSFRARTESCQYEVRIEWYGGNKWGIPLPLGGGYIKIKHCPWCGEKVKK